MPDPDLGFLLVLCFFRRTFFPRMLVENNLPFFLPGRRMSFPLLPVFPIFFLRLLMNLFDPSFFRNVVTPFSPRHRSKDFFLDRFPFFIKLFRSWSSLFFLRFRRTPPPSSEERATSSVYPPIFNCTWFGPSSFFFR